MTTGHAIDSIVDENDSDVLATVASVNRLAGTDGREVTVALIGEYQVLGPQALYSGGQSGGASVRSLFPVHVDVVVGKHGATNGRNADGLFSNTHFLDDLGNEFVYNAMAATRAIVHVNLVQQRRCRINFILRFNDIVKFHCVITY